jgi:hypothetical protein
MPFTTILDELFTEANTGVDKHLMKSTYSSNLYNSKNCGNDIKTYNPHSIDRKILPYFTIEDIPDIKDKNLDMVIKGIFQEYTSKLQESRERELFDDAFDRTEMDKQIVKSMNWKYDVGVGAFYIATAIGIAAVIGRFNLIDANFASGTIPLASSFAAFPLTLIEHWGPRPIGKLLMSNYTNSKILGTSYYEEKLRNKYYHMIHKYASKHSPEILETIIAPVKKYVPLTSKEKILGAEIFNN